MLLDLPLDTGVVTPAPSTWTPWRVTAEIAAVDAPGPARLDGDGATMALESGGSLTVDRESATATFHLPRAIGPEALLHPYLVPVAALAAYWRGDVCFHAGAFVHGARAWGVLAPKDGGKSSLMAALAVHGLPIVADDALVLRAGRTALAGPQCLDLRESSTATFAGSRPLGRVGERDRWRLAVDGAEPETPFGGWVTLGWEDGPPRVSAVGLQDRLQALGASLTLRAPPRAPQALLDAALRPMLRLDRPRDWSALAAGVDALLGAIDGLGGEPGGLQE